MGFINVDSITDEKLVERILSGDLWLEEVLYKRYKKIITKYLKIKHNTKQNTDDFVSEILIKIFINLPKFNSKKQSFKAWALGILKNHMIDFWRKNKIEITYDSNAYEKYELVTSTSFNFEELNHDNVWDMCYGSNLSKKDVDILELKYVYGYTYDDIGCFSGVSATYISNRINYIKTKIKNPSNSS